LEFQAKLRGGAGAISNVDDTIRRLKLEEKADFPVSKLSGGQKKRVSIGMELVLKPRILFLDEPTSSLDAATGQKLLKELSQVSFELVED